MFKVISTILVPWWAVVQKKKKIRPSGARAGLKRGLLRNPASSTSINNVINTPSSTEININSYNSSDININTASRINITSTHSAAQQHQLIQQHNNINPFSSTTTTSTHSASKQHHQHLPQLRHQHQPSSSTTTSTHLAAQQQHQPI